AGFVGVIDPAEFDHLRGELFAIACRHGGPTQDTCRHGGSAGGRGQNRGKRLSDRVGPSIVRVLRHVMLERIGRQFFMRDSPVLARIAAADKTRLEPNTSITHDDYRAVWRQTAHKATPPAARDRAAPINYADICHTLAGL